MARPNGPGSCPTGEAASASSSQATAIPRAEDLRHYARRSPTGVMEIVDRQFDFVRCVLPYDYRFTCNAQQWREAGLICWALEGPMESLGYQAVVPLIMADGAIRCTKTGNPCGTDTTVEGRECPDARWGWRCAHRLAAQAMEAQRGETEGLAAKPDSAVGESRGAHE